MDAQPRIQRAPPDPAWERVRRWPGLRGEDKLAWWFCWRHSRGGSERILVTPVMIAEDQGTSSDAGRQRLKNLAAEGLVLVTDRDKARGTWELELLDPTAVAKARKIEWDGQHEFDFDGDSQDTSSVPAREPASVPSCGPRLLRSTEDPPAEEPPEDPPVEPPEDPRRRTSTSTSKVSISRTSTSFTSSTSFPHRGAALPTRSESTRADDRGTSGGSSAEVPVGSLVGQALAKLPSPAEKARWVEDFIDLIVERVACPNLRRSPCFKIADAVAEGRVERGTVMQVLAKMDDIRQSPEGFTVAPSAYFNGAIKKILSRC